jgi:hypothetical protein
VSLVDIGPFGKKTIPPALQVTFTDSAGTAINVTSMTVTCTIRPVGGSSADDVIRTGAVVTGASGIVKYQWVEADTTTPGSYRAWMHVSDVVTDNPIPSGW